MELQRRFGIGFPNSQLGLPNVSLSNSVGQANAHHQNFGVLSGLNPLSHANNTSMSQQQSQLNTNTNVTNSSAAETLHSLSSNERMQNERLQAVAAQHNQALANAHLASLHHADPSIASLMAAGQLPQNLTSSSQSQNQPQQPHPSLLGQQQTNQTLENNQLHQNLSGHPMLPHGFNAAEAALAAARGQTPNPALFQRPDLNHPGAGLLRPPHVYDEQLAHQVNIL